MSGFFSALSAGLRICRLNPLQIDMNTSLKKSFFIYYEMSKSLFERVCQTAKIYTISSDLYQVEIHLQRNLLCASFTEDWHRAGSQLGGHRPRLLLQKVWCMYSADCPLRLTAGVENLCHFILSGRPHILFRCPLMQFTWHFRCPSFALKNCCTSCFWNPH